MTKTEQIKERLSIEELLSSYITLERAGKSFKAKCPFHNERSPSFFVSPDRGTYYCFGCGAKGDIFTFVEEFEGLDFKGALKLLAERTGIRLDSGFDGNREERDELLSVLEEATSFYERELKKNEAALSYLSSRGMELRTAKEWRLGFAPDGWRNLISHLLSRKFPEIVMEHAGLVKRPDKDKGEGKERFYDRFRSRIMFPIFDGSGRVIAFSGRIFKEKSEEAKYINSPESPVFSKSKTLYGLNKAKQGIRRMGFSILVEGQFDLVLSHERGFTNTVALSGTALTEDHLTILKRLSSNLMLAFDGDSGGFRAALKSAASALEMGMTVKVASLPQGQDPSDIVVRSRDEWKEILKSSKHIIEYHLDHIILREKDERKRLIKIEREILPYVVMLQSGAERSFFISLIGKHAEVKTSILEEEVASLKNKSFSSAVLEREDVSLPEVKTNAKDKIVGIILWQKNSKTPMVNLPRLESRFLDIAGSKALKETIEREKSDGERLAFEAERLYGNSDNLEADAEDLMLRFEEDSIRLSLAKAKSELITAEEKSDALRLEELEKLSHELSLRLEKVLNRGRKDD